MEVAPKPLPFIKLTHLIPQTTHPIFLILANDIFIITGPFISIIIYQRLKETLDLSLIINGFLDKQGIKSLMDGISLNNNVTFFEEITNETVYNKLKRCDSTKLREVQFQLKKIIKKYNDTVFIKLVVSILKKPHIAILLLIPFGVVKTNYIEKHFPAPFNIPDLYTYLISNDIRMAMLIGGIYGMSFILFSALYSIVLMAYISPYKRALLKLNENIEEFLKLKNSNALM